MRTFRPAQILGRKNSCRRTRGLYDHRRSLLDARSPHPIAADVAGRAWRRRDTLMKLPWLWKVPQRRNQVASFAFRRVDG
jgi:hypothetical protein